MRKYSYCGLFCIATVFVLQTASFAYLVREQDEIAGSTLRYTQSSDRGYDFVKISKPATETRPAAISRQATPVARKGYQRSSHWTPQSTPVHTTLQSTASFPTKEQQLQRLNTVEVSSYKPVEKTVYPHRKVIHRAKAKPASTLPKELIAATEKSAEPTLLQQKQRKQRYLDALYLRAEAFYEAREYDACMQTLNSVFMFDPYHVKSQRLRRKVEIKASKSRSGREGPSFFNRIFGNSKHRKQIGLARKLYKDGKYEQAMKICQKVIIEDPYNSKAERYIVRCRQKLEEPVIAPEKSLAKPLGVQDPDVEDAQNISEDETLRQDQMPAEPVVLEDESSDAMMREGGVYSPGSKEEAQDIALSAILQSMRTEQLPQEKTEEKDVESIAIAEQKREPTMEELAVMARNNLEFNDAAKAQDILDQMLVKDPNDPLAQEVMNDISQWIQEDERVKSDSETQRKRRKETIRRTLQRAKKAYKLKNYDHARALYEKVIDLDPANRSARKGIDKIGKQQKKETVKGYIQSIEMLHVQKRYDEANVLISKGLDVDPSNRTLKRLKDKNKKLRVVPTPKVLPKEQETISPAKESEQQGQTLPKKEKKGLFSFLTNKKKPLTENELQTHKLLKQAKAEYKKGDYSKAISLYEQIFHLDPENKKASKGVDRAREKMILKGRDKNTAKKLAMKNEIQDKVDFYTSMAEKLHRQGKYDSAKIVIHKGLLLDPDNVTLKKLCEDNDGFVKQMASSPTATEEDKRNVQKDALVSKGVKQYLLGDYDEAIKYFNKVLTMDPTDEKAKNSIEKIESKRKKLNLRAK